VAAARADSISGTLRRDRVVGTKRADRIAVEGGGADRVRCGAGHDVVTADRSDRVASDCEVVSLRVSSDPYRNAGSRHQTQVEPDSFSYGSTIVTAFQSGRFFSGGASNIGWAASTNGGRMWKSGFLPGVTDFSRPRGAFPRVSDPAVAYDATHGVWMIAGLGFSPTANAMLVSRSRDRTAWSSPVTAVASRADLQFDKDWIACDNWPSSPFRGSCYLSYADFGIGRLMVTASRDGGATWSAPVPLTEKFEGEERNGVQPVVRPDGSLLVVYAGNRAIEAAISTDGGSTFAAPTAVAPLRFGDVPRIRSSPLPSVEVDAAGTVFVAWSDCSRRAQCADDDVLLASSTDGHTWSAPTRVPTGPAQPGRSYFTPGLAADPAAPGHIGITYYELAPCGCAIDVGFIGSSDGGATWHPPERLDARSMRPGWLAPTSLGLMVGDYISTSFVGGRPLPVFALGSQPSRGSLHEAVFVTTRGLS